MSETLQYIGNQIKKYMQTQNISVNELVLRSNLTKPYIYQVLNAEANISINKLESLCNALNIHISDTLPISPKNEFSSLINKINSLKNKELMIELLDLGMNIDNERDLKLVIDLLISMQRN